MPNPLASPEDILNVSLQRLGYRMRIGSIWEGSDASKAALDVYAQTRDDLLRDGEWQFCQRIILLTLQKSASNYFNTPWSGTTNPPFNYLYQYAWPDDCLKVRSIRPPPAFPVDLDPQPTLYDVVNDDFYSPPQRVIVCNIGPTAYLFYSGRVTDPLTWSVDFTEEMIAALARRLAPILGNLDVEKAEAADEAQSTAMAESEQG